MYLRILFTLSLPVMMPISPRVRMRIKGSTEKDVLAGRGPVRLALKVGRSASMCHAIHVVAARILLGEKKTLVLV